MTKLFDSTLQPKREILRYLVSGYRRDNGKRECWEFSNFADANSLEEGCLIWSHRDTAIVPIRSKVYQG